MEGLKRSQRATRRQFEKLHRDLEVLLKEEELKDDEIRVKFKMLTDHHDTLTALDNRVMGQLTEDNASEADEDREYEEIRDFKMRYEIMRIRKEKILPEKPAYTESVHGGSVIGGEARVRNFKLPTVQVKKFSGEITDWLAWWAQFRKIDEDQLMHGSDKFWYLSQSLEPGTDAYILMEGYHQTDENYPKAIAALKKRYGSQDMLLQVYIRQLLNLVISNVGSKDKIPVKSLYLKLDSHLRALKTLELEKADPATWLFPLVESSLPDKILDNWQRSPLSSWDGSSDDPPRTRLDLLMEFMEKEVEIGQKIEMTRAFASDQSGEKKRGHSDETKSDQRQIKIPYRRLDKRPAVPTLTSFHSTEKKSTCVFCSRNNHDSTNCWKAQKMTYDARMEVLRRKNLCFRCCGNHHSKNCNVGKCNVCDRNHAPILCRQFQPGRNNGDEMMQKVKRVRFTSPEPNQGSSSRPPSTMSSANIGCAGDVALKTLMVKVASGNREVLARAFIDDRCQRSYLLKETAENLGLLPSGRVNAIHLLWGGHETAEILHKQYEVQLRSTTGDFCIDVTLREQTPICGKLSRRRNQEIVEELEKKNIYLSDADYGERRIELLIGADIYPHLLTGDFVKLDCGPAAIRTKLGWTLLGEIETGSERESTASAVTSMVVLEGNLTRFWDLELLGIRDPAEEIEIKKKEEIAREEYLSSISRDEDGRYLVKLPWKENLPNLPDNRAVAFKRLQSATAKLEKSGMFEKYNGIFAEWEREKFIERVTTEDEQTQLHYLPHRPVIKTESLTTPVRPVFDASCRVGKSPSLNDCLFTGDNYILQILDVLLRFREKKVAFISDIRKAFQMIGVDPADRDTLRFLWWADHTRKEVVEYRHARVVFGVTCSPLILAVVLYHHLTNLPEEERDLGRKLLSTLYVDNCASSEDTVEEYSKFRDDATQLMNRAKMDLRMWLSNVEKLEDAETRVVSVLGLLWDRQDDVLSVNMKNFVEPVKVTKRSMLSTIQKVFDPIGFTCPCILPVKILLQQTWQGKAKWDEQLPETVERQFVKWCREAADIPKIKIPRLCSGGNSDRSTWRLFVFSDASAAAYSATVFLRVESGSQVSVQLLAAKSRVAPVKKMTIPKLELMGCLLGVRLLDTVRNGMKIDGVPVRFYTDSTTALAWIKRNDQRGTFVANRVKEIRKSTAGEQWLHVPGIHNPADLPSRGCFPSQLVNSKWWEGPSWLYQEEIEWPMSTEDYDEDTSLAERKKSAPPAMVTSFSVMDRVQTNRSFDSLVRVVGWVRRFLFNKFVKKENLRKTGPLRLDELRKAEKLLLREIQRDAFPDSKKEDLTGLELVKDDWGLLRVKTRLTYREDLGNFRYPVLLPWRDDRVKRLIEDNHRYYCHAGVGFMMTILRRKYWIIKSRHTIRGVVYKCERCRKHTAKSVIPEPAPLPLDRIKDAEPFEVTGVDLAGPLILRNGSKVWMVIYTCSVYRAVHFDLKIDWASLEENEKTSQIEWKFNPATSSWWGGWWERLIKSAKELIKRTVGKGSLSWEEMRAILKTVAEVMNNRPLTYVTENPEDLEPLTPALFLHPFGKAVLPERELTEGETLRFRLQYVNTLRKELKMRFLREYLAMLVNRHPKKATRKLKVGELVFIGYDNLKRVEWPLGRVLEMLPGKDDVCRLARVKTEKGEIVRSVQRLYPLEADSTGETRTREIGITRSGRQVRRPERFD